MQGYAMRWSIALIGALLSSCGDDSNAADAGAPGRDAGARADARPSDAPSGSDAGSSDAGPSPCEPVAPDFCEAPAGSRCFYIDAAGSDDADGSAGAPWASFVNVNRSIYPSARGPRAVDLAPGDVVYVMSGVYSTIYHPGDDGGPDGGGSYLFHVRGIDGTPEAPIVVRAFPGHRPILDPASAGVGMLVSQSSHVRIDGMEIRNARERGIRIEESTGVVISRVVVHDTDGRREDNLAGLEVLGSTDVEVHHSVFYDNYDRRPSTQTENSRNVVLFSNSGRIAIHHSVFYQTNDPSSNDSGAGVGYKHSGRPGSTFELYANHFENLKFSAIHIGTHSAHIHHNTIVGNGLASSDMDGPTHQYDQVFEYNSFYGDAALFYMSPTLDWVEAGETISGNRFRRNVLHDTSEEHRQENRTIDLGTYASDELVTALAAGLVFEENCYFAASGAPSFGFGEAAGGYGALGGAYDLAGWREAWSYDLASIVANPEYMDAAGGDLRVASSSACAEYGAFTGGIEPVTRDFDPFACP
jgi:hypothetical protein